MHIYTRSLDPLSLMLVLSIRSVRPSLFAVFLVYNARSRSLQALPLLSFPRSHRPSHRRARSCSPSLSLSLSPSGFVPDTPTAFPAPVDSSSSRQPHRFSFCVLLSVCVEPWMCVRVGALFPACTFHGPVPPARRFPGLVSSLVSSRSLSLSIHREPLVCHLSRSLLGRSIAVRVLL